ncbi:hypothetical protein [Streptomyces mirabilis]|uniref:hypothetical protein n=1 Tax=Streptomyces mirabilis TaxID=68239 RepID=UPI0036DC0C39
MNAERDPLHQPSAPVVTEPVPDVQLQMLVRLIGQDAQAALPITLVIGGGFLYGDLVSHETWRAGWARNLRGIDGPGASCWNASPSRWTKHSPTSKGTRSRNGCHSGSTCVTPPASPEPAGP